MQSSSVSRWIPLTEQDLQVGIDQNFIEENHHMDVKREVELTRGGNKEAARDLASFAVDGGILLVGIDEDKKLGTFHRHPVALHGLPERIEQIAQANCDPPLFVRARSISSSDDPTKGYIVVEIPASPDAPHMVEGKYYGRGEKTKTKLSDAQVERLILARGRQREAFANELEEFVKSDPWSPDWASLSPGGRQQTRGHLFLLAKPLRPRPQMALAFTHNETWENRFRELARTAHSDRAAVEALAACDSHYSNFVPDLDSLYRAVRRPGGAALTVHELMAWPNPSADANELKLFDLQLSEDGDLKLYCARATERINVGARDVPQDAIAEILVVGLTRRVIDLARLVADHTGYGGAWDFGLEVNGIENAVSMEHTLNTAYNGFESPYGEYYYTSITRASAVEIADAPGYVTERLVGRLLRSLGTAATFEPLLSDRAP